MQNECSLLCSDMGIFHENVLDTLDWKSRTNFLTGRRNAVGISRKLYQLSREDEKSPLSKTHSYKLKQFAILNSFVIPHSAFDYFLSSQFINKITFSCFIFRIKFDIWQ